MKLLRGLFTRKIFTLLAGITFLNMSFILAELTSLDLAKKYRTLLQLVNNAGLEEEETGGETEESDPTKEVDKEVDLIAGLLSHYEILFSSAERKNKTLERLLLHPGHGETFSPPPDSFSPISC